MNNPRQQARQKICSHVATIRADLRKIERTTLSLSKNDILLIANGVAIRFNLIIAIYEALDQHGLPHDERLPDPPQMTLDG